MCPVSLDAPPTHLACIAQHPSHVQASPDAGWQRWSDHVRWPPSDLPLVLLQHRSRARQAWRDVHCLHPATCPVLQQELCLKIKAEQLVPLPSEHSPMTFDLFLGSIQALLTSASAQPWDLAQPSDRSDTCTVTNGSCHCLQEAMVEAVEDCGFEAKLLSSEGLQSLTLHVAGMTCSNCSSSIETALLAQAGVSKAAVSVLTSRAEVRAPVLGMPKNPAWTNDGSSPAAGWAGNPQYAACIAWQAAT